MANFLDKTDVSLAPTPRGVGPSKIVRFRWARPASPGRLTHISKQHLNLDDRYQRGPSSNEAVVRIARDFDWTLFGVLKVAERGDGSLWVFDGGHRLRACFYHSDIDQVPCIVFQMEDFSAEARAFIAGAKMSASINAVDTFRASVTAGEPVSVQASALLKARNITVDRHNRGRGKFKSISTFQRMVQRDPVLAERTLDICILMAGDASVSKIVLDGMFTLATHFPDRDILADFKDVFERLTQQECERAIRRLTAESGVGGNAVAARAIMGLLNKGRRTRLAW